MINWEALELTAPVLESSLASCRGIFGHALTLALVLDPGSRAVATGWCVRLQTHCLCLLSLPAVGRELGHSVCS